MSEATPSMPAEAGGTRHDRLIASLSGRLQPVRRVSPAWLAAGWLLVVIVFGAYLGSMADIHAMMRRLGAAPDMWLAALGSALTGVLAVVAAFMTGIPGRSPRWALLPLPPLALWIWESGMGCARGWHLPGVGVAGFGVIDHCFLFICGLSLPLSLLLMVLLRWTLPLRPNLTLVLGGLAAAGAAATLLNFFHPYDASVSDLLAHALAVMLVVGANRLLGGRLFR
jgi:hypothetical protein